MSESTVSVIIDEHNYNRPYSSTPANDDEDIQVISVGRVNLNQNNKLQASSPLSSGYRVEDADDDDDLEPGEIRVKPSTVVAGRIIKLPEGVRGTQQQQQRILLSQSHLQQLTTKSFPQKFIIKTPSQPQFTIKTIQEQPITKPSQTISITRPPQQQQYIAKPPLTQTTIKPPQQQAIAKTPSQQQYPAKQTTTKPPQTQTIPKTPQQQSTTNAQSQQESTTKTSLQQQPITQISLSTAEIDLHQQSTTDSDSQQQTTTESSSQSPQLLDKHQQNPPISPNHTLEPLNDPEKFLIRKGKFTFKTIPTPHSIRFQQIQQQKKQEKKAIERQDALAKFQIKQARQRVHVLRRMQVVTDPEEREKLQKQLQSLVQKQQSQQKTYQEEQERSEILQQGHQVEERPFQFQESSSYSQCDDLYFNDYDEGAQEVENIPPSSSPLPSAPSSSNSRTFKHSVRSPHRNTTAIRTTLKRPCMDKVGKMDVTCNVCHSTFSNLQKFLQHFKVRLILGETPQQQQQQPSSCSTTIPQHSKFQSNNTPKLMYRGVPIGNKLRPAVVDLAPDSSNTDLLQTTMFQDDDYYAEPNFPPDNDMNGTTGSQFMIVKRRNTKCEKCSKTFKFGKWLDRHRLICDGTGAKKAKRLIRAAIEKRKQELLKETEFILNSTSTTESQNANDPFMNDHSDLLLTNSSSKSALKTTTTTANTKKRSLTSNAKPSSSSSSGPKTVAIALEMLENAKNKRNAENQNQNDNSQTNMETDNRVISEDSITNVEDLHPQDNNANNNVDEPLPEEFICYECGREFRSAAFLRSHAIIHAEGRNVCKFCNKKCRNAADLTRHVRVHTGEKPEQCNLCGKSFRTCFQLKYHIISHSAPDGKPFKCTEEGCKAAFTLKSTYQSHRRRYHPASGAVIKPFACPWEGCERTFIRKANMEVHHRVHSGEAPYICHHCGKGHKSKCSLNVHVATHNNPDQLCTMCGKGFKTLKALLIHETRHQYGFGRRKPGTDGGPNNWRSNIAPEHLKFECNVCKKRFVSKQTLRTHSYIHQSVKPLKCKYCDRTFVWSGSLQTHENTHTRASQFKCPVDPCTISFSTVQAIKRHCSITHGIRVELVEGSIKKVGDQVVRNRRRNQQVNQQIHQQEETDDEQEEDEDDDEEEEEYEEMEEYEEVEEYTM